MCQTIVSTSGNENKLKRKKNNFHLEKNEKKIQERKNQFRFHWKLILKKIRKLKEGKKLYDIEIV